MVGKAGLKAGLIGVVVMLVWTLINQFVLAMAGPLMYVGCGVSTLLYVLVGVLAAFFLATPRTPSKGAKAGAIAGLISGLIATVVGVAIIAVRVSTGAPLPNVDPQQMQQLAESGMDVGLLVGIFGTVGALCGMTIGAGAAAIGGAILAAIVPD